MSSTALQTVSVILNMESSSGCDGQHSSNIAAMLKAFERGEKIDSPFAAKLEAARGRDCLKFAVVMDDKVLTIEMAWTTIRETSEAGISEYIVNQMREARDAVN